MARQERTWSRQNAETSGAVPRPGLRQGTRTADRRPVPLPPGSRGRVRAALHAVAEKNIAVDRGPRRCCDVRADLADAAEYPVPDEPLVVYIYNSFCGAVMDRVLANPPGRTGSSPGTSGSSTGTRRRRPCSTGTGSPASPIRRKARRSIGRAIGASYGGCTSRRETPAIWRRRSSDCWPTCESWRRCARPLAENTSGDIPPSPITAH